jgi:tRNA(Ile)-lysidine synthetase-like protein
MDAELLEELAEQSLEKTSSLQGWKSLPPALLPRVLRLWLHKQYGEDLPPSARLCRRLKKTLDKQEPLAEIIPFEGRRQLYLDQAGLRVYTQSENDVSPPQYWRWSEQTRLELPQSPYFLQIKKEDCRSEEDDEILAEESFARDELPELLFVRYWQNGDTMRPFGADYTKKLQDLFVDARVPREDRRRLPLLLAGEQIIWLPTLRRAEFGRLRLGEESLSIQFGVKKNPL